MGEGARAGRALAVQFKLRADKRSPVPCPTANRTALWVWWAPLGFLSSDEERLGQHCGTIYLRQEDGSRAHKCIGNLHFDFALQDERLAVRAHFAGAQEKV